MSKYWFRKRRGLFTRDLGWGYNPISWEGWLSTAIFLFLIFFFAYFYRIWHDYGDQVQFLVALVILIVCFVLFAHTKTKK